MKKMEKKVVALNSDGLFEYDIANGLKELIDDRDLYYHIEMRDDLLSVEKQGYNMPMLDKVCYDLSKLIEDEYHTQKLDAIKVAYLHTFYKTGGFANNKHAFYHDRTGLYPEEKILESLKRTNSELFKENTR